MNLIEFRDRVFVLMEWAWNYFTWNRGARLITGRNLLPADANGTTEDPRGDGSRPEPKVQRQPAVVAEGHSESWSSGSDSPV